MGDHKKIAGKEFLSPERGFRLELKEQMMSRLTFKSPQLSPRQYHNLSPVSLKQSRSIENFNIKYSSPSLKLKNDLAEKISSIFSSSNLIDKLKNSFDILKLCSDQDSFFSKEMKIIADLIHCGLFINKAKIDKEVLSLIYTTYTESALEDAYIPFFYAMECTNAILLKTRNDLQTLSENKINNENRLNQEISIKNKKIAELENLIQENIKNLELQDKYAQTLIAKINYPDSQIRKLEQSISENEEFIKQLRVQNSSYKRRILELQSLDDEKSSKISELEKVIEDQKKDIKNQQSECEKIKYYFKNSLSKIKILSNREAELESRASELESKNQVLSIRAAEGFDSLTPRPSFSGTKEILGPTTSSTREKTRKLITALTSIRPKLKKKTTNPWKKSSKLQKKPNFSPEDFP